jgi:hypothetical protein
VEVVDGADRQSLGLYGDVEALLWWMRGAGIPQLATTSPVGTPVLIAGARGMGSTSTVIGDVPVNNGTRGGFRVMTGLWLDSQQKIGLEGYYFMIESQTATFATSSGGTPILARPYTDANTGVGASQVLAYPDQASGSISVREHSAGLLGAGALLRDNLCRCQAYRVDLLVGYRYLNFSDDLDINASTQATGTTPTGAPAGTGSNTAEHFGTRNEFQGIDVGASGEVRYGPFALELLGKLAVGYSHETLERGANTVLTVPGSAATTVPGGLLILPSNLPHVSRREAALVPEFGVRLGYQVTPHLRAVVGYTLLYWDKVVRPGEQVDLTVNPTLLPGFTGTPFGPTRPNIQLERTYLLTQGLNLGIEFRY